MLDGVCRCMVERTTSLDQSRPGPGPGASPPAVSESMFARPSAVVAVSRTVLAPAFSVAWTVTALQLGHAPVPGKLGEATTIPLTAMSAGRAVLVPLA